MTAPLAFCPYCGSRIAIEGAQFCASCGQSIAGPAPRPAMEVDAPARVRPASGTAGPSARSGPPAGWPVVGSWDDIGAAVRVAAVPVGVWFVLTLLISALLSDAVRSSIGASGFSGLGSFGRGFAEQVQSAGAGAVGALIAGLGFQVGTGGQAGAVGTQTNVDLSLTLGLVPLSTMAVFAVLLGRGSRAAAAAHDGTRLQDLMFPALLAAAGTALAMYLGSLILSSSIGDFLASQDSGVASTTVRGGPTISGLAFVLFPILAVGSVTGAMLAGGWPLVMERLSPHLAAPPLARVIARAPLLLYGVAGYLVALLVGSIIAVAVLVVYSMAGGADVVGVVRLLPSAIVLIPNVIAGLVLAGTGAQIGLAIPSLPSNSAPQVGSLWDTSIEWIVAGILAVIAPGLIAGIITRRRMPAATPGLVAVVGGLTGSVALIGAIVAVPSLTGIGTIYVGQGSAGTRLVFDLGHAVVVGGTLMVVSALIGFRFGGALADRVPEMLPR